MSAAAKDSDTIPYKLFIMVTILPVTQSILNEGRAYANISTS